jgi:nucleoside-diphosphate-sugar epimerase
LPEIRNPAVFQDFVHVEDVARALLMLTRADIGSGVFNVGSGAPTTVGEIVNQVAAFYGRPAPFPALTGQSGFWADTTKIVEATGWSPEISIADGIRRPVAPLQSVH